MFFHSTVFTRRYFLLTSKSNALKPLIISKEGQHLTAYLTNDGTVFHLQKQLFETLDAAYEYLKPVMSAEELTRFAAPILNVIEDTALLKELKGSVGLFRNESSFRLISIPLPVEQLCIVAKSFHIKPLLRWLQVDRDFLFLDIAEGRAKLYKGNQTHFVFVDSILSPALHRKADSSSVSLDTDKRASDALDRRRVKGWLQQWLQILNKDSKFSLFVSDNETWMQALNKEPQFAKNQWRKVSSQSRNDNHREVCKEIRSRLIEDSKTQLERALIEFYQAEDFQLAKKNIFQIAKAAVKGKVKKLIIADGIYIFGKIDKESGGLAIHPTHLDNEDDDILDDLAQEVLAHGGEVIVASLEDLPKRVPIMAVLGAPEPEASRVQGITPGLSPRIEVAIDGPV